jgi:hypothetical protein
LADFRFAAAITTNYDSILERMADGSAAGTFGDPTLLDRARCGTFFILKLFGDPMRPASTLLTAAELRTALEDHEEWRGQIREISRRKMMLFVGCSAEYLLADLRLLGCERPADPSSWHYALVGVEGGNWRQIARELETSHGVRLIAVPEQDMANVLPVWLEALEEGVAALLKASGARTADR